MGTVGHESEAKIRIIGSLMSGNVSKEVTVLGDITKVENDGKKATMCTTDGCYIQMVFVTPLIIPLKTNCLTEVFGIVINRNQIQCYDFVQFTQEMSDKFDRKIYNEFVAEFFKLCDQHFNVERPEDHEGSVISPIDNFSMPNISLETSFIDTSFTN